MNTITTYEALYLALKYQHRFNDRYVDNFINFLMLQGLWDINHANTLSKFRGQKV